MQIEIEVHRNIIARSIDLYVFSVPGPFASDVGKRPAVMTPAVFIEEEDALRLDAAPSLRLEPESAQHLMDALWWCGVRPTEESTVGQVKAMAAHLQDMRKLVFDFIEKIGKPPFEISGKHGPVDVNNLASIDVEKFLRG